jgi:hypothetical protein
MGKTIYIDDLPEKAILTHSPVNKDFDDFTIKTLYPIQRGDLINYDNNNYLVLSQVNSDRYGIYKGLMRKCNFVLHVKVDTIKEYDTGGHLIKETPIYEDYIAIITTVTTDWNTGQPINLPDGEIQVIIKDTGSTLLSVNDTFDFEGLSWTIHWIDRTQNGLLILKCKNG